MLYLNEVPCRHLGLEVNSKGVRIVLKSLLLCLGIGLSSLAWAQSSYPNKPIRFIIPYPPGGGTDFVARVLAQKLTLSLGQPVVLDNKPGASTIIGTEILAKAQADGYTMGVITDSHAINPTFFPKLPYDSLIDFEMVSQLVFVPLVLVANPQLKVKTLPELIALAKKSPGKINYASIGNGSPHNMSMEWVKNLAGVDIVHVPYKGVGPALADVLAGQVDLMFTGTSTASTHVKSGKLIALAVSSAKRQASFPDIPSVAESGLSEFDFMTWYGTVFPAGTPKDIVSRMSREIGAALLAPEMKEKFATMGVVAAPSSPEEFTVFMKKQIEFFARMIKTTGVKPE